MENNNALITVSMLYSYLREDKKDYLDLLAPFILKLLPKEINERVNKDLIIKLLKDEYGFEDLPLRVLDAILIRYSKTRNKLLNKHKEGNSIQFTINLVYNSSSYDKKKKEIIISRDKVIDTLHTYLRETSEYRKISKEETEIRLKCFLEEYCYNAVCNPNVLREMTNKSDSENYHVGRFIIEEYKKKGEIFLHLEDIFKGFLAYKALYFFYKDGNVSNPKPFNSKLKNVVFYFDTTLLIDSLGYDREEGHMAVKELIKLIKQKGGKVKTFIHNKDEFAGILTKYARDIPSRPSLSLWKLYESKYDKTNALRLRGSLVENLEDKAGIEVVPTFDYGDVSSESLENKGYLDLEELKSKLLDNYNKIHKQPSEDNIMNDCESISSISRIRKTNLSCEISECKAIFVTTNLLIISTLRELYKQIEDKGFINYAIYDMDLTAILWIKNYNTTTNLSCFRLLESAYAALDTSEEVILRFKRQVELLVKEGKISDNQAFIMRTMNAEIVKDLGEIVANNPENVNDETVAQVERRYKERVVNEKQIEIDSIKKGIKEKKEKNIVKADKNAEDKSRKDADILKTMFRYMYIAVLVVIIFILIYVFAKNLDIKSSIVFIAASIFITIINIILLLDSWASHGKVINKIVKRYKIKKYDKYYHEEMERIKEFDYSNIT